MEVLAVISAIASIIGCIISIWQACIAKKYANVAKDIEVRLGSMREIIEIEKIEKLLKRAIDSVSQFSNSHSQESLAGLDFTKARKNIDKYIIEIKRNSLIFKFDSTDICEKHCNEIELQLSHLDLGKENLFTVAKNIHRELKNFYKHIGKWSYDNNNILVGLQKR